MKAKLEFTLPEERLEHKRAMSADSAYSCLWEISQEIFRPYRKHGYSDNRIPNIDEWTDREYKLLEVLEEKFYQILKETGINLDDY